MVTKRRSKLVKFKREVARKRGKDVRLTRTAAQKTTAKPAAPADRKSEKATRDPQRP